MSKRNFDHPVYVKAAARGLIEEIGSLGDALEYLYDWPENRRGVIYTTALRACQRVTEDDYPLSAARDAFESFAKSTGVLAVVSGPLPWTRSGAKAGGGATA